jgi:hypothetical protein
MDEDEDHCLSMDGIPELNLPNTRSDYARSMSSHSNTRILTALTGSVETMARGWVIVMWLVADRADNSVQVFVSVS